MSKNLSRKTPQLKFLSWDSDFFGFPIAAIQDRRLGPRALAACLERAQAEGIHLVYWDSDPNLSLPDHLLQKFSGCLVDQRVNFVKNKDSFRENPEPVGFQISECHEKTIPPSLYDLAFLAGHWSRFHKDPWFSDTLFRKLYRTWIERSVKLEIADLVLVSEQKDCPDSSVNGLLTIVVSGRVGKINLFAVDPGWRRKEVARYLIARAERWVEAHQLESISGLTQRDNVLTCRFLGQHGYDRKDFSNYYHFWLRRPRWA